MSIKVKFFASMRELAGNDQEITTNKLASQTITTVNDVWNVCTDGKERPANVLIAVNMEYVDGDFNVADGDEVAFFPPVTGG